MNNRRHLFSAQKSAAILINFGVVLLVLALSFAGLPALAQDAAVTPAPDTPTPTGTPAELPAVASATPTLTLFPALSATPLSMPAMPPTPTGTAVPYTWHSVPGAAEALASDRPLSFLAGKLIVRGLVDASACPSGGLISFDAANTCGLEVARGALTLWQNQFDAEIYQAARKLDLPPFLLKNVLMRESQFWPESHQTIYGYYEVGLGHTTEMGADTALRWNPEFAKEFCKTVYSKETCKTPYALMPVEQQYMLRGAVVRALNADCNQCLGGIDLNKARAGIPIIANVLKANRNFASNVLGSVNNGQRDALLWRYTLASYNAGPGCISIAAAQTRASGDSLDWKNVAGRLDPGCKGAIAYVDTVLGMDTIDATQAALAATDNSLAARLVLNSSPNLALTATSFAPTATPLLATLAPAATSTPTAEELSATPDAIDTPAADTATPTLAFTETPTLDLTATPTTALDLTGTPAAPLDAALTPTLAETSTPEAPAAETPAATETPFAPTDTPAPSATPTEIVTPEPVELTEAYVPGEIVVKFKGFPSSLFESSVLNSVDATVKTENESLGSMVIEVPQADLTTALAELNDSMHVEYAEPNYAVQAFYTPNDPDYVNQNYLAQLQIPDAWDLTQGKDVIVAVIDTGMDLTHPDLNGATWVNVNEAGLDANGNDRFTNGIDDDGNGYVDDLMGWNFVANNKNMFDDNGHGTHLAGIIAARMDNDLGVAGIAPQSRIMALKALDANGVGSYANVASAIIYAVDNGARVIELGFGGTANSEALRAATDYAYEHGVVVVAAGGNTGDQTVIYPAYNPNVIAVSALNDDLTLASFSTFGNASNVAAPGVGIYSTTVNGGYAALSGTSMSSAEVAGVAALIASSPNFPTGDKVREALIASVQDLGAPGWDAYYGDGMPRAFTALNFIPNGTATPTFTKQSGTPGMDTGGVSIMAVESLWGTTNVCSYSIANQSFSLDKHFSGDVGDTGYATCQGTYAASGSKGSWEYDNIEDTNLVSLNSGSNVVVLNLSFAISGNTDDQVFVQIWDNSVAGADKFVTITTPSGTFTTNRALSLFTADVSTLITSIAEVNAVRVRVIGGTRGGGSAENITISFDEVRLDVSGTAPTPTPTNTPITPTATITPSPTNTSTGPTATFTPTFTPSPTPTSPYTSPHGDFHSSTDACSICHRPHSAQSSTTGELSVSPLSSNDYCLSCHDGSKSVLKNISTHSNVDFAAREEAQFELLCVQCHNPHGNTTNLYNLRSEMWLNYTGYGPLSSTVVFTNASQPASYDDNAGNGICVQCHTDSGNIGYPMTKHADGDHTASGGGDYTGQVCTNCHRHNLDGSESTRDGFMGQSCVDCHSAAQNAAGGNPAGVRQITSATASGDFYNRAAGGSHHVTGNNTVKDGDCVLCHDVSQHTSGTVWLRNVDTAATYALDGGVDDADQYDSFCLACHDANGNNGDTTPFSDNVAVNTTTLMVNSASWTASSHTIAASSSSGGGSTSGSCRDCHSNGHGSNKVKLLSASVVANDWAATSDSDPDDPRRQEERFCYICHDSNGPAPAALDIASSYFTATNWIDAPRNKVNGTLNMLNDRHDVKLTDQNTSGAKIECVNCHNPHTDNSTQKFIVDPDPANTPTSITNADSKTMWCLDCHDGTFPTGVNGPTAATLTNINTTFGGDSHGGGNGATKTLRTGTGFTPYVDNVVVQCEKCHTPHRAKNNANLYHVVDTVYDYSTSATPMPSDGASYNFIENNSDPYNLNTNGYYWCNTCHTGSMGNDQAHTNCSECHYHGSNW